MKKVKRIIAGMAAAVMAFSTMSIAASAYPDTTNWPTFNLHYSQTAPPTANLTTTEIFSSTFQITHAGQLTVDSYITQLLDSTVTIQGWVSDNSTPNGWGLAVSFSRNTLGFEQPHTNYYPNISGSTSVKVKCIMNYPSGSYDSKAKGKVTAY